MTRDTTNKHDLILNPKTRISGLTALAGKGYIIILKFYFS